MRAEYFGYLAGVVWITIPLVYWMTAPDWHRTRVGRAFMWLVGSTALLFLLLLTGGIFGDYAGRDMVRGAVFLAVLYAGVRIIILFVRLRAEGILALAELARLEREAVK